MAHDKSVAIWDDSKSVTEFRKIFFEDLNDTEFKMVVGMGMATGLNPFMRELYATVYNKDNPSKRKVSIFIGRDGYRKAAAQHKDYDYHLAEAVYSNDKLLIKNGRIDHQVTTPAKKQRGMLVGAYCVIKRKSATQEIHHYVDFGEYNTGKNVWASKPATMIKKVAEAQGLRMAFPDLFGGTYDSSEQWDDQVSAEPRPTVTQVVENLIRPATHSKLEKKFNELKEASGSDDGKIEAYKQGILKTYGKKSFKDITEAGAQRLIDSLGKKIQEHKNGQSPTSRNTPNEAAKCPQSEQKTPNSPHPQKNDVIDGEIVEEKPSSEAHKKFQRMNEDQAKELDKLVREYGDLAGLEGPKLTAWRTNMIKKYCNVYSEVKLSYDDANYLTDAIAEEIAIYRDGLKKEEEKTKSEPNIADFAEEVFKDDKPPKEKK